MVERALGDQSTALYATAGEEPRNCELADEATFCSEHSDSQALRMPRSAPVNILTAIFEHFQDYSIQETDEEEEFVFGSR